jgi:hypothetical protein
MKKGREIVSERRKQQTVLKEDDFNAGIQPSLCPVAPTRQGFFGTLHGHQSKTLALFVWGAIKAQSIVLAPVAEELLSESDAKAPSIERRLQRDVA